MSDAAVVTAQNRRPHMEDHVHVEQPFAGHPDSMYVGVFDGHGGAAVSRRAARDLHALLAAEMHRGLPPDVAMFPAFRAFDETVAAEPSGSTAAVLVLQGDRLTVANAGDSHIILVSRGKTSQLTAEHRLTNEAERQRVVAAGAELWGQYACLPDGRGLMCTRSLGDREFRSIGILAEPAVATQVTTAEDLWVIAATDGVWDGLEPELVGRIAMTATTARDAAERIRDAAVAANPDNVSVVAIHIH